MTHLKAEEGAVKLGLLKIRMTTPWKMYNSL